MDFNTTLQPIAAHDRIIRASAPSPRNTESANTAQAPEYAPAQRDSVSRSSVTSDNDVDMDKNKSPSPMSEMQAYFDNLQFNQKSPAEAVGNQFTQASIDHAAQLHNALQALPERSGGRSISKSVRFAIAGPQNIQQRETKSETRLTTSSIREHRVDPDEQRDLFLQGKRRAQSAAPYIKRSALKPEQQVTSNK